MDRTRSRLPNLFALLAVLMTCLLAGAVSPRTVRASTPINTEGNAASLNPVVDEKGDVAFESSASNLIPGDTNGVSDVFLRSATGHTTRLSVSTGGDEANGPSTLASISDEGRYVAFQSSATNLVPGDTNSVSDLFVRDVLTGTTTLISQSSSGAIGTAASTRPSVSADGQFVAFASDASNLVPGDTNSARDVFLRDINNGTTIRVSVDSAGAQANGASFRVSISAWGQSVAFQSDATNLVAGDTNAVRDVFVRDLNASTTTRISTDSAGVQGNGASYNASMSSNGAYVAFTSQATNLGVSDTNGTEDILVRDLTENTTQGLSVTPAGNAGNGDSWISANSADGRYVAFVSWASDLVPGDTNGVGDVFLRDLTTGSTIRASIDSAGNQGNGRSQDPAVSGDGGYVAFDSDATNFVVEDGNTATDVFLSTLDSLSAARTLDRVSVASDVGTSDAPIASGTPLLAQGTLALPAECPAVPDPGSTACSTASSTTSRLPTTVDLYADPSIGLAEGTVFSPTLVASTYPDAQGKFVLRVPYTTDLANSANANGGYDNFHLIADTNTYVYTYAFTAKYVNGVWVPIVSDDASPLDGCDGTDYCAGPETLANGSQISSGPTGGAELTLMPSGTSTVLADSAGTQPGNGPTSPAYDCWTTMKVLRLKNGATTIGELHTATNTTGTLTYGQTQKADSSISVAYSVNGGPFKLDGYTHQGSGSSSATTQTWKVTQDNFDHREDTVFRYGLYEYKRGGSPQVCPKAMTVRWVEAVEWESGATTGASADHSCSEVPQQYSVPEQANSTWTRSRRNYAWFEKGTIFDVDAYFGHVHVGLNSQSGLSDIVKVKYHFGTNTTLCGNDGAPTVAHRVFVGK